MATDDLTPATPRRSGSLLSGASVLVAGRYAVAALAWVGTRHHRPPADGRGVRRATRSSSRCSASSASSPTCASRASCSPTSSRPTTTRRSQVVGSYTGLRLVIGLVSYAVAIAGRADRRRDRQLLARRSSIGTVLGGLNLVILSVAYGMILLFEARLWLRDVAISQRARPGRRVRAHRRRHRSPGSARCSGSSARRCSTRSSCCCWLDVHAAAGDRHPDPLRAVAVVDLAEGGGAARAGCRARHRSTSASTS